MVAAARKARCGSETLAAGRTPAPGPRPSPDWEIISDEKADATSRVGVFSVPRRAPAEYDPADLLRLKYGWQTF